MSEVKIGYERKIGRFVIQAPFALNGLVRRMPSRRFNKTRKAWLATATRRNVEYMRSQFMSKDRPPPADQYKTLVAKEALAKMEEVDSRVNQLATGSAFPSEFKFVYDPYPFQDRVIRGAFPLSVVALPLPMGTGKTKISIDLVTARYLMGQIDGALVWAPASILRNWRKQIALHTHEDYPVDVHVLESGKYKAFDKWLNQPRGDRIRWLVASIEGSPNDKPGAAVQAFLDSHTAAAWVDESSRIKNPSAQRTQAISRMGEKADYKGILSGTMATKGLEDLYSQYEFLSSDILGVGDYYAFRSRYCILGGFKDKEIVAYDNLEEFMSLVKPFTFRVTKEEALPDLPPKVHGEEPLTVKQGPDFAKMYKEIQSRQVSLDGGPSQLITRMLRLRQLCAGLYVTEKESVDEEGLPCTETVETLIPHPKMSEIMQIVEDVSAPMVLWTAFVHERKMLKDALVKKYGAEAIAEVHGGIPLDKRHEENMRFQDGDAWIVIGQPQAGGIGIELYRAEYELYISNTLSLEDREQSEDRVHRDGLKNMVKIDDIVVEGSVEYRVRELLREHKDVLNYIHGEFEKGTLDPGELL